MEFVTMLLLLVILPAQNAEPEEEKIVDLDPGQWGDGLSDEGCTRKGYSWRGWSLCRASGRCIPFKYICDGINHCSDSQDENRQSCQRKNCHPFYFTCDKPYTQTKCLHRNFTCDGELDCQDGSDEHRSMCEDSCRPDQFRCKNDQCIPMSSVCDGSTDCDDGSDEDVFALCPANCKGGRRCKDNRCVPECCVCNGIDDCGDGSDEEGCPTKVCEEGEFQCSPSDGGCIPLRLACDKAPHCPNSADEDPSMCFPLQKNGSYYRTCERHEFQCRNQLQCIPNTLVGDGTAHCSDGSDEIYQSKGRASEFIFGPECTTEDGEAGNCVKIDDCPEALSVVTKGKYPQICEKSIGNWLTVCCRADPPVRPRSGGMKLSSLDSNGPLTPRSRGLRLSDFDSICGLKDKLNYYEEKNKCHSSSHPYVPERHWFWCGSQLKPQRPAVGGTPVVDLATCPWMVSFGVLTPENKYVNRCGGTLLTDRHVVTAAHCFALANLTHARIADLDLSKDTETPHITIGIKAVHIHPAFKYPQVYNDIAVIELSEVLPLSRIIRPACLPKHKEKPGIYGEATGFGLTSFGGSPSDKLLRWKAYKDEPQRCARSYLLASPVVTRKYQHGFNDSLFCAGNRFFASDACLGDSGGGFMIENIFGRFEVVGVVSFGIGCGSGDYPGIYTTVSQYTPWITNIIDA